MKPTLRWLCKATLFVLVATMIAACGGDGGGGGGAATTAGPGGAATSAPTGGDATTAPADGAATTAPADGAATTAPADGAATTAPADGAATTAPTGGETGGAAMTLPAECTNVELQFWNPFSGPDGPFMAELAQRFSDSQDNINVTMTAINNNNPPGALYSRLGTAQASGELPHIAAVHADQIATLAFRNTLRPIDELVTQMGITEDDYPPQVWGPGTVAGQRYSIPLDVHPMTMFYNADLLQGAGISSPPKTREEFEQAATALTTGDTKGFMITTGFPIQQIFQQLLHQFGGSEFSEDGTKATWNSDAGVQALQWMLDAQSKYGEPNLEVDAELNAFRAGTVGMIWNGIWQTANMTGESVEFNGMATLPPQIGSQPATWGGSHQLVMPAQTNEDQCADVASAMFIKYVVDNSVEWARAGQIPASNTVRNSAEFKAIEPQASIAAAAEGVFFPPAVPGITDAFSPLGEAVGAVMSGQATDIKATLDEAAARADQILEQNRQNFGEAPAAP